MSEYTDKLMELGRTLKEEGWDARANMIFHAAQRMESMEVLLIDALDVEEQEKHDEKS